MAHLCRSKGRPELESQLGVITGQYRRLLSSCIVRAQAQCLISRIGVISPEARVAAQRREVTGRLERKHSGWQAYEGLVGRGGDVAMVFKAEEYSVFTFCDSIVIPKYFRTIFNIGLPPPPPPPF